MRSRRNAQMAGTLALVLFSGLLVLPTGAMAAVPMSVGGGPSVGGFLGDVGRDWGLGVGADAFAEVELMAGLDARLVGSIRWNDGRLNPQGTDGGSAHLGGKPGESPRSFRRSAIAACAIYRFESKAYRDFLVPYAGMGVEYVERKLVFDTNDPAGERRMTGSDGGVLAIAGLRFYRTSGLFVALEGRIHGLDTPQQWTAAYDASILVGAQLGL